MPELEVVATAQLEVLDGGVSRPLDTRDLRSDLLGTKTFGAIHALAGRRFAATTDYVTLEMEGEQDLAAWTNPADSGVVAFIDVGEFGADRNTRFRRYGAATLDLHGTPRAARPTGRRADDVPPAKCSLWAAGQYDRTGGEVRKTAHILAYGQYPALEHGAAIAWPGARFAWSLVGPSEGAVGHVDAAIFWTWVEIPLAVAETAALEAEAM